MRIAQVAPLYESVPPRQYGGTERVVSYLTEELVRQGHDLTLYASGDSRTAARLVSVCEESLWHDKACQDTLPHHIRLVERALADADRYDVIHFHCDYLHFPLVRRFATPTVTTLHGVLLPHDVGSLFRDHVELPLISISNSQREPLPWANWLATVYHGLPRDLLQYHERPGEYLAFLGRFSPEKGVEAAIEIARRAGLPLKIAAKMYAEETYYFNQRIAPLLKESPWVEYVGEVDDAGKNEFLGNAKALVFPINWAEPFGLVMIESMACGTPVVAFRRGSVPEVIAHGTTGFIVNTVTEAVEAISRLDTIRRQDCRHEFERRFIAERMARDYVMAYQRLISRVSLPRISVEDSAGNSSPAFAGLSRPYRQTPAVLGPA